MGTPGTPPGWPWGVGDIRELLGTPGTVLWTHWHGHGRLGDIGDFCGDTLEASETPWGHQGPPWEYFGGIGGGSTPVTPVVSPCGHQGRFWAPLGDIGDPRPPGMVVVALGTSGVLLGTPPELVMRGWGASKIALGTLGTLLGTFFPLVPPPQSLANQRSRAMALQPMAAQNGRDFRYRGNARAGSPW